MSCAGNILLYKCPIFTTGRIKSLKKRKKTRMIGNSTPRIITSCLFPFLLDNEKEFITMGHKGKGFF